MKSSDEIAQEAADLFSQGYTCSQSVFSVFATDVGMDRALALKVSSGFGGGMGRLREVCGAVSGMFMAASMAFGSESAMDAQSKAMLYTRIQELANQFKAENGSIICRELLAGAAVTSDTNPIPEVRTEQYYKKRPCKDLCACAARIFADFLNSQKEEQ